MVKSGKTSKRSGALLDSPSHLMHRVLQLSLDIYAEEAGPDGPTQRQYAVMEAVSNAQGLTQTDLVRATGIDRSTLADLVTRMTAKGLLERERSVVDARAKAVRLSIAGEVMLNEARPRVLAADKRILALLPKGKRDGFVALLAELAAAADAGPDIARAEAKAAKKALKEAKRAEKAAKRAAEGKPEKKPKGKKSRGAADPATEESPLADTVEPPADD